MFCFYFVVVVVVEVSRVVVVVVSFSSPYPRLSNVGPWFCCFFSFLWFFKIQEEGAHNNKLVESERERERGEGLKERERKRKKERERLFSRDHTV